MPGASRKIRYASFARDHEAESLQRPCYRNDDFRPSLGTTQMLTSELLETRSQWMIPFTRRQFAGGDQSRKNWDTLEQFRAFIAAESERWGKVIRAAGIELQ